MKDLDPAQGIVDELQAWYLEKAEQLPLVYTQVVRLLVAKIHRDMKYLKRRKDEGFKTQYDFQTERDLKVIAWTVQQLVLYLPDSVKAQSEPPPPPRPPRQRRKPGEPRTLGPSWNGQPKRGDWQGAELPPAAQ
jgi:hypothetical protein